MDGSNTEPCFQCQQLGYRIATLERQIEHLKNDNERLLKIIEKQRNTNKNRKKDKWPN